MQHFIYICCIFILPEFTKKIQKEDVRNQSSLRETETFLYKKLPLHRHKPAKGEFSVKLLFRYLTILIVIVFFTFLIFAVTFTLPFFKPFNFAFVLPLEVIFASFFLLTDHFTFPETLVSFAFRVMLFPFFTFFFPVILIEAFFFFVVFDGVVTDGVFEVFGAGLGVCVGAGTGVGTGVGVAITGASTPLKILIVYSFAVSWSSPYTFAFSVVVSSVRRYCCAFVSLMSSSLIYNSP